jgi:phytoene dehydrogenase-like protein
MADKSFDVVIIGGGNKGLVTAMYLTKYGGMSVGIFEERHELGGGWCSEEQVGGYICNVCSSNHSSSYHKPTYRDFPEWEEYGAKFAYNGITNAIAFEEDDAGIVFYHPFEDCDYSQEKTAQEIARYSEKDADRWLWLWDITRKIIEPCWDEWQYNPAIPFGTPDGLDKLMMQLFSPEGGFDPVWMMMSPLQIARELFESIEMQMYFLRMGGEIAYGVETAGGGIAAVTFVMIIGQTLGFISGGTHQLAHAAHRVIYENGGRSFTRNRVDKVLIENGKAKGIRLADGTEIEAKKAVVTALDPHQLIFNLVGEEHFPEQIVNRVKNLEVHCMGAFEYMWALKERPDYKAAAVNPDFNRARGLYPERKDVGSLQREAAFRRLRRWMPDISYKDDLPTWFLTFEDHLSSPSGVMADTVTLTAPLADDMTDRKTWKKWEDEHKEALLRKWQKYAPNMTWDNVIDVHGVHPGTMVEMNRSYVVGNPLVVDPIASQSGRFRPIPELADHRTPIKGLYATGTSWHPYPSAHSSQGYNCYKVMADDFGLKKPWEEGGYPW